MRGTLPCAGLAGDDPIPVSVEQQCVKRAQVSSTRQDLQAKRILAASTNRNDRVGVKSKGFTGL